MTITRPAFPAMLAACVVVAGSLAAVVLDRPPAPVPASAPAGRFSAARAMAHVERIAARPHPTGSASQRDVRDYLVATLEGLGFRVERQQVVALRDRGGLRAARVENLMVRLEGRDSTGALLLASHYDSVPAAPGAADAGSGVAALLETLRALKSLPAPRNDVIVLLTDAEEYGLLGATAFVEQHPWAREVRAAVNLEARGTGGPSQMFETGPGNLVLVREWAAVVPRPAGASLTYEVYKRMPNDTDFSAFRTLGIGGLNFAFIGSWGHYHTPLDSVASLDRRSLQHHGEAALALARRLGDLDLMKLGERDAVYFSVPVAAVAFHYSSLWALPLAALAVVVFVVVVVRARRRNDIRLAGLALAIVLLLVFTGLAGFFGYRFERLLGAMHARWLPGGAVSTSASYAGLLVAVVTAVWLALYALLRRRFAARTLALAAGFVLVVASAGLAWFLVGASYVTLWPALALLIATMLLPPVASGRVAAAARALLVCVLALPAVAILWPLVAAFFRTLGLAPMSGAAMGAGAALALGALAPQTELLVEGRRWWAAAVAGTLAVLLLLWGAATTRYSAEQPRAVNMTYVLDADARAAHWTARADRGIAWVEQFVGPSPQPGRPAAFVPPWSSVSAVPGFLTGGARAVDLPGPMASVVRQVVTDGGRVLTLHLVPAAEGHALSVWLSGARVVQTAVEGRSVPSGWLDRPGEQAWSLDFINPPAAGIFVVVDCKGSAPITLAVLDRSPGLPDGAGRFAARPPEIVPVQSGDQTVVRRTFVF